MLLCLSLCLQVGMHARTCTGMHANTITYIADTPPSPLSTTRLHTIVETATPLPIPRHHKLLPPPLYQRPDHILMPLERGMMQARDTPAPSHLRGPNLFPAKTQEHPRHLVQASMGCRIQAVHPQAPTPD